MATRVISREEIDSLQAQRDAAVYELRQAMQDRKPAAEISRMRQEIFAMDERLASMEADYREQQTHLEAVRDGRTAVRSTPENPPRGNVELGQVTVTPPGVVEGETEYEDAEALRSDILSQMQAAQDSGDADSARGLQEALFNVDERLAVLDEVRRGARPPRPTDTTVRTGPVTPGQPAKLPPAPAPQTPSPA